MDSLHVSFLMVRELIKNNLIEEYLNGPDSIWSFFLPVEKGIARKILVLEGSQEQWWRFKRSKSFKNGESDEDMMSRVKKMKTLAGQNNATLNEIEFRPQKPLVWNEIEIPFGSILMFPHSFVHSGSYNGVAPKNRMLFAMMSNSGRKVDYGASFQAAINTTDYAPRVDWECKGCKGLMRVTSYHTCTNELCSGHRWCESCFDNDTKGRLHSHELSPRVIYPPLF